MNLHRSVLAVALAVCASTGMAKTADLGTLGAADKTFGNSFSAYGDFTDYYTFQLGGDAAATGGTITYDSFWQDISLTAITLQRCLTGSCGASGWGTVTTDSSPGQFSFSGLSGGVDYRLAVAGTVDFTMFGGQFGNASYSGTIHSIASAAPEPGALAMAIAGLMGVSLLTMRGRRA